MPLWIRICESFQQLNLTLLAWGGLNNRFSPYGAGGGNFNPQRAIAATSSVHLERKAALSSMCAKRQWCFFPIFSDIRSDFESWNSKSYNNRQVFLVWGWAAVRRCQGKVMKIMKHSRADFGIESMRRCQCPVTHRISRRWCRPGWKTEVWASLLQVMEVQTYLYTEAICKMEDLHRSKLSELQSFAEFALATHRNLRCLIWVASRSMCCRITCPWLTSDIHGGICSWAEAADVSVLSPALDLWDCLAVPSNEQTAKDPQKGKPIAKNVMGAIPQPPQ